MRRARIATRTTRRQSSHSPLRPWAAAVPVPVPIAVPVPIHNSAAFLVPVVVPTPIRAYLSATFPVSVAVSYSRRTKDTPCQAYRSTFPLNPPLHIFSLNTSSFFFSSSFLPFIPLLQSFSLSLSPAPPLSSYSSSSDTNARW